MVKKDKNKLNGNLPVEHLVERKKLNQVLMRCKHSVEKKKEELKYKGSCHDQKEMAEQNTADCLNKEKPQ